MKLSFIKPRPELQPYIESLWIFESPNGLTPTESSIAAPNGCPKLIFLEENSLVSVANGKVQRSPAQRLYFIGNKESSARLRSNSRKIAFIGIEFFSHGAFPIFGIPMSETVDRLWNADEVFGKWGSDTQKGLRNRRGLNEKVAYIQDQLFRLLLKNVRDNRLVEHCVKTLKSADGRISLLELERQTGYSCRYLDLLFRKHVGFRPKFLAEVFRFQRFYRKWAKGQSLDLFKEELYDYYFDQSHFIREFKRMTGLPPRKFSREVSNEFGRRLSLR